MHHFFIKYSEALLFLYIFIGVNSAVVCYFYCLATHCDVHGYSAFHIDRAVEKSLACSYTEPLGKVSKGLERSKFKILQPGCCSLSI